MGPGRTIYSPGARDGPGPLVSEIHSTVVRHCGTLDFRP